MSSTTVPVLVHLPAFLGSVWSWTVTMSPRARGGRTFAPKLSLSSILQCLLANACSLRSASSLHSLLGWYLDRTAGKWSLTSLPKRIMAGLRPVRGSGVLRCSNKALANLSVSSWPLGPRFSITNRLALLTATSLLLLALG